MRKSFSFDVEVHQVLQIDSMKNDNAAIYGRGFFFCPQKSVNSTLFSSLLTSRPVLIKQG